MTDLDAATDSAESGWIEFTEPQALGALLGSRNENLRHLQHVLATRLLVRGRRVAIEAPEGEARAFAARVLQQLYELTARGFELSPADMTRAAQILRAEPEVRLADIFLDTVLLTDRGRPIGPRGPAQKTYVDAIRRHDIVFGVGPAGTGKTYLAMAMGLDALAKKQVKRIILTRPAVEAGERLGFLPGDLAEKVNPYLRPLKDALHDMMDTERSTRLLERGTIEVAPLAFMRGRTLNDSFVILDEAQNATREQMKMFLTRLGFATKAVVTGDITQIDLPDAKQSGLTHAIKLLKDVAGIAMCRFTDLDVVRHPLVAKIIQAYDRAERGNVE